MNQNKQTVQDMYTAFGRGDIPAIINTLSDDIVWTWHGPADHPFGGERLGKEAVGGFFTAIDEHCVFEEFSPQTFLSDGDFVVCLGHMTGRVKSTGKTAPTHFAHVWHFRDGRPVKFEDYHDTAKIVEAFRS